MSNEKEFSVGVQKKGVGRETQGGGDIVKVWRNWDSVKDGSGGVGGSEQGRRGRGREGGRGDRVYGKAEERGGNYTEGLCVLISGTIVKER